MRTHPLARRYARALFELALKADQTGPVLAEMQALAGLLQSQGRIKAFLLSPGVDKKKKQEAIGSLLGEQASPLFHHFVLLLLQKGRLVYYGQMVTAFAALYDRSIGRVHAELISAVPLQPSQLERVRGELGSYLKAEVLLENRVDDALLGGVIIKFSGVVIDGSLRHQLNQLRRELHQTKVGAAL